MSRKCPVIRNVRENQAVKKADGGEAVCRQEGQDTVGQRSKTTSFLRQNYFSEEQIHVCEAYTVKTQYIYFNLI